MKKFYLGGPNKVQVARAFLYIKKKFRLDEQIQALLNLKSRQQVASFMTTQKKILNEGCF